MIFRFLSRTSVLAVIIAGLLFLNALTVLNHSIQDFLYGAFSSLPFTHLIDKSYSKKNKKIAEETRRLKKNLEHTKQTNEKLKRQNKTLQTSADMGNKKLLNLKNSIKSKTDRIVKRTVRNVSLNVSSVPADAIPIVGTAAIIAMTAVDVKDACDTMNDMNEIMELIESKAYQQDSESVCGQKNKFTRVYAEFKGDAGAYILNLTHYWKEKYEKAIEKFGKWFERIIAFFSQDRQLD